MDTLCGVGLPELIILILVGFVVIGPERSRELALTLGRWMRRFMQSAWWREFNQVSAALRDLPTTLVRMAELEDAMRQIRTDLNKAGQLADDQSPQDAPPVQPTIPDPWGIQDATTGSGAASPQPPTPKDDLTEHDQ